MILQILFQEPNIKKMGQILKIKSARYTKKIPAVSALVKKTDFNTKVIETEGKIPSISGLLPTNTFNSKVGELENKIKTAESKPDLSNLVNKTELKNVENKRPDSNGFVKRTDYATEISGIKNAYVNTMSIK